jgi:hypothetical protein
MRQIVAMATRKATRRMVFQSAEHGSLKSLILSAN